MRTVLTSIVIATLVAASTARPEGPSEGEPPRSTRPAPRTRRDPRRHRGPLPLRADRAVPPPALPPGPVPGRPCPRTVVRPVVVGPMVEALEAEPEIRDRYQFWTFGYSTGDPILYSAWLLRRDLDDARRRLDPAGTDGAFDRAVVVGHSMGGLLAKMMVQDSGIRPWRLVSDRPFDELAGDPEDRDLFRRALFFQPRPEVRRVVFIATPHRGSPPDRGRLPRLGRGLSASGSRCGRPTGGSWSAKDRGSSRSGSSGPADQYRGAGVGAPVLTGLSELGLAPGVAAHSIVADHRDPPRAGEGDGLVPYDRPTSTGWRPRCSCRPATCARATPP